MSDPTATPESPLPWQVLRWVVGLQFVAAGCFSAVQWQATVEFNALLTGSQLAPAATAIQIALAVGGGLSLAAHVRPRWGAIALLVFLVPATARHGFAVQEVVRLAAALAPSEPVDALAGLARRGQMASIAKNLALIGLALFVVWRGSLEPRAP